MLQAQFDIVREKHVEVPWNDLHLCMMFGFSLWLVLFWWYFGVVREVWVGVVDWRLLSFHEMLGKYRKRRAEISERQHHFSWDEVVVICISMWLAMLEESNHSILWISPCFFSVVALMSGWFFPLDLFKIQRRLLKHDVFKISTEVAYEKKAWFVVNPQRSTLDRKTLRRCWCWREVYSPQPILFYCESMAELQ